MSKKPVYSADDLPFAEFILKPADSRPIVVSMQHMGGHVEMSAGDTEDCIQAQVALRIMAQVVQTIGITRQLKEDHERQPPAGGEASDDIPF